MKPHSFQAFAYDANVCDICGEVADAHNITPPEEFRKALWTALIRHGGVYNQYSGEYDYWPSWVLRAHFGLTSAAELAEVNATHTHMKPIELPEKPCTINYSWTRDPTFDVVYEFAGTEADSDEIPAVTGTLRCGCADYRFQEVALLRKTMGQLMWLVVKAADGMALDVAQEG